VDAMPQEVLDLVVEGHPGFLAESGGRAFVSHASAAYHLCLTALV
jgi:hypothetical protein